MVACIDYTLEKNREYDRKNHIIRFKDVVGTELDLPRSSLEWILHVAFFDGENKSVCEATYPFVQCVGEVAPEEARFLDGLYAAVRADAMHWSSTNFEVLKYNVHDGVRLCGTLPLSSLDFKKLLYVFAGA